MTRSAASRPSGRDLLLVAPALAAWGAALGVLVVLGHHVALPARSHGSTVALILAAGVAATGAGLLVAASRHPRVVISRPGARRAGAAVLLLAIAAGAGSAALHAGALAADPLAGWADQRAVAEVDVRIEGDPRVRSGQANGSWRAPDTVEVRGRLLRATARGRSVDVDVPVAIGLGPRAGPAPDDGTLVRYDARLGPPRPGSDAAATLRVSEPGDVLAAPGTVAASVERVRSGLRAALAGRDADAGALVAGLSVGDESLQQPELAEAMRVSGLSHLTAVSGGNVAIVLIAVLGLARLLGLRRRGRAVAATLSLAAFVTLVRPQPSVVRAAAMGSVAVLAVAVGGRRRAVPALALAVLVLVVSTPALAASYGFALSVAATAGLLVLAEPLRGALDRCRPLARWPPALLDAVTVTVAAQLATAPLVAALGGGIGLAAVPANLLAAPAVAPVTVLGLVAALLAVPAPWLAGPVAAVACWPAGWIASVAHRCAALPAAQLPWPEGPAGGLLLAGAMAVAVAAGLVWRRAGGPRPAAATTRSLLLVGAVLAVLVALRPPSSAGWPPPGWVAVACDVGQGDALAVRTGPGRALVVDAGPDPDAVDRCLDDLGVDTVPAVVLTHDHADHVEGLPGVLRGRSVGVALVGPLRDPIEQADRVAAWLADAGVPQRAVGPGERSADGDATWQVLWPRRVIRGDGSMANNASVVLVVEAAGLRLLLPGDVEPPAQAAIAATAAAPAVDVVKVPHHGSRYQWEGFAAWSGASIALVSVGADNDYGHPAQATLDAYSRTGLLVGRTDQDGDLAVVATEDGVGLVARNR